MTAPPPNRVSPPPSNVRRLSCGTVRSILRNNYGFYNIRAFDCKGKTYWFYASRNGKHFKVKANSINGGIVRKIRL